VASQRRDIHDPDDLEHRQEERIARLREEAAVREGDLAALRERLAAAEHELEDLRAIRDALTPPELSRRLGARPDTAVRGAGGPVDTEPGESSPADRESEALRDVS
jgi:hypothetical protein